jgi:hypothetical protein
VEQGNTPRRLEFAPWHEDHLPACPCPAGLKRAANRSYPDVLTEAKDDLTVRLHYRIRACSTSNSTPALAPAPAGEASGHTSASASTPRSALPRAPD